MVRLSWSALVAATAITAALAADKPNIIFILTDDQDSQLGSLEYMPLLRKHMIEEGTSFTHHYCTVAQCCPARATLWTGLYAHNTNVTDLVPPFGGWPKFVEGGWNNDYLPLWLGEAGYQTYYVGKLFNAHNITNYDTPCSKGWSGSEFLLEPWTYNYFSPGTTRNCGPVQVFNGTYNTDLVANRSFGFLDDAVKAEKPFFLTMAPIAPHTSVNQNGGGGPPVPNTKYANMFKDVVVPRTESFNPDVPSGASWIKTLPKLNSTWITYGDHWYQSRLQALQSVDEMVDNLFAKLEEYDILDNTYIIFSSDNGFHISQHRLAPGKTCGYEEDVNVPLIIRGPGVPKNVVSEAVSAHTDLTPTFFELAGLPQREEFDGVPIAIPGVSGDNVKVKAEHASIEFWSLRAPEQDFLGKVNNTYKSLRLIGDNYNLYYSVWCSNEHELYDMSTDPAQMHNLFAQGFIGNSSKGTTSTSLGVSDYKLATRLDGLLFVLKSCEGITCREPWEALLPGTGITTLTGALSSKYDCFFANEVPRVSFLMCVPGHIVAVEGPQYQNWSDPLQSRDNGWAARGGDPHWAMWT